MSLNHPHNNACAIPFPSIGTTGWGTVNSFVGDAFQGLQSSSSSQSWDDIAKLT